MEDSQKFVPGERSLLEGVLYYAAILLRYKILIILITFLGAALVVGFSIVSLRLPPEESPMPNLYRAYSIVLFQKGVGGDGGMSSMLSAFGVKNADPGLSSPQLAMQILRSRDFTDRIVEKFDLINYYKIEKNIRTRSREAVSRNSEYIYNRETGTMTIAYTDIDPVKAAEIVNFQVEQLRNWFLKEGVTIRSSQLSMMERKLEELSREMKDIEDDIKAFQKKHGVLDILELATAQSAMLTSLRTSLNQVELEITNYTRYSNIEDPALSRLRNRRNDIVGQIRRIEEGYTGGDGRRMPSQAELPQLSLDFTHLTADLALKTQLYRTLSERYEVTKLAEGQAEGFSVLERAEVPEEKIGPSRGILSIRVTLFAFAGSAVLAFFIDALRNIVRAHKKKKLSEGTAQ